MNSKVVAKWTPDNESRLLLILLAHYSKPGGGPNWDAVAKLMGEEYTAGGVSQHYTKKMVKREAFVEAKESFGKGTAVGKSSSPSSLSKKRKVEEIVAKLEKQEMDEDFVCGGV
jgi:hypothetical protein